MRRMGDKVRGFLFWGFWIWLGGCIWGFGSRLGFIWRWRLRVPRNVGWCTLGKGEVTRWENRRWGEMVEM